jgi:carbon starvation protein CstA
MNLWIAECLKIVRITLGNPTSNMELGVFIALGAIALVFAIHKIADLLGAHQASTIRATLITIISVAVMLAAVAAVNIYVTPKLAHHHTICKYLPIATAVVVFLVVSTPMMCLIQKTSYLSGFFSLVLSVAVAAVIVALASAAFNAFHVGGKDLEKQKERKDTINKIME